MDAMGLLFDTVSFLLYNYVVVSLRPKDTHVSGLDLKTQDDGRDGVAVELLLEDLDPSKGPAIHNNI